jgi:hypothetical protein
MYAGCYFYSLKDDAIAFYDGSGKEAWKRENDTANIIYGYCRIGAARDGWGRIDSVWFLNSIQT